MVHRSWLGYRIGFTRAWTGEHDCAASLGSRPHHCWWSSPSSGIDWPAAAAVQRCRRPIASNAATTSSNSASPCTYANTTMATAVPPSHHQRQFQTRVGRELLLMFELLRTSKRKVFTARRCRSGRAGWRLLEWHDPTATLRWGRLRLRSTCVVSSASPANYVRQTSGARGRLSPAHQLRRKLLCVRLLPAPPSGDTWAQEPNIRWVAFGWDLQHRGIRRALLFVPSYGWT